MLSMKNGEAMAAIWFGNFFKPAFDDRGFVRGAAKLIGEMGFNAVELDTKDWADFRARYQGEAASDYVAMQEYMMQVLHAESLPHMFLALYLNGDNLYPNIRFSPPVYGESVQGLDGADGRWYRYWSEKSRETQAAHVRELFELYGKGHAEITTADGVKMPVCSMWDPIVAPSFDDEGRRRYTDWLSEIYNGNIAEFNRASGVQAVSFRALTPQEYWYEARFFGTAFTREELESGAPRYIVWRDNQKWRRHELVCYFAAMREKLLRDNPALYLTPNLSQWGVYLNVDGRQMTGAGLSDLWDTAVRGIDPFELAPYVDNAFFMAVPVTPAGDPDAYVVACAHAMMRGMNRGRDFHGGVYFGRYIYNDLYAHISPAEIIASIVASGAKGYSAYGMCGLDDGGILHRMDEKFRESLRTGNAWMKRVTPLLGARKRDVAILFPSATAAYEPFAVENADVRRLDFLGWFHALSDAGYQPDVLSLADLKSGVLPEYRMLILPADDAYRHDGDSKAEDAVRLWVQNGGSLLYGPQNAMGAAITGQRDTPHALDDFLYTEKGILQGDVRTAFHFGEALATYLSDGAPAAVRSSLGLGTVYGLGFFYGYCYTAKDGPHVPPAWRNEEMYPVKQMRDDIAMDMVRRECAPAAAPRRGVESAVFENGTVLVNHTPFPVFLEHTENADFQYPCGSTLLPHSAVYLPAK